MIAPNPAPQPEVKARDLEIYDLVVRQGWSQWRVAAQYKITQQRVSQICCEVNEALRIQFLKDIRNFRMRQTQQLEELYFQAVSAWHRSQGEAIEVTRLETKSGATVPTVTKELAGDKGFLSVAAGILKQIHDLWAGELKAEERGGGKRRFSGLTRQQIQEKAKADLKEKLNRLESQVN